MEKESRRRARTTMGVGHAAAAETSAAVAPLHDREAQACSAAEDEDAPMTTSSASVSLACMPPPATAREQRRPRRERRHHERQTRPRKASLSRAVVMLASAALIVAVLAVPAHGGEAGMTERRRTPRHKPYHKHGRHLETDSDGTGRRLEDNVFEVTGDDFPYTRTIDPFALALSPTPNQLTDLDWITVSQATRKVLLQQIKSDMVAGSAQDEDWIGSVEVELELGSLREVRFVQGDEGGRMLLRRRSLTTTAATSDAADAPKNNEAGAPKNAKNMATENEQRRLQAKPSTILGFDATTVTYRIPILSTYAAPSDAQLQSTAADVISSDALKDEIRASDVEGGNLKSIRETSGDFTYEPPAAVDDAGGVVVTVQTSSPTPAPVMPTPAPVAPTPAPVEPTPSPVEPTEAPVQPTQAPTPATPAPTSKPTTAEPTVKPTESPTVTPGTPTVEPTTSSPSSSPTSSPTATSTSLPTSSPASMPTSTATGNATGDATANATTTGNATAGGTATAEPPKTFDGTASTSKDADLLVNTATEQQEGNATNKTWIAGVAVVVLALGVMLAILYGRKKRKRKGGELEDGGGGDGPPDDLGRSEWGKQRVGILGKRRSKKSRSNNDEDDGEAGAQATVDGDQSFEIDDEGELVVGQLKGQPAYPDDAMDGEDDDDEEGQDQEEGGEPSAASSSEAPSSSLASSSYDDEESMFSAAGADSLGNSIHSDTNTEAQQLTSPYDLNSRSATAGAAGAAAAGTASAAAVAWGFGRSRSSGSNNRSPPRSPPQSKKKHRNNSGSGKNGSGFNNSPIRKCESFEIHRNVEGIGLRKDMLCSVESVEYSNQDGAPGMWTRARNEADTLQVREGGEFT